MERNISKLEDGTFDLLVIGGGINGAGIAYMATLNGLRVALVEKNDFASGTSSKSTKLLHGGLRYLENFEFDLVKEALRERSIFLKNSAHLVKPLRFIIPVYKKDQRPFWWMKLGVKFYDFLCGKNVLEKSKVLTKEEVCERIVDIKKEGLLGAVEYSDAQMNDARLCLENILMAVGQGAQVANFCEVQSLIKENGKTVGVSAFDKVAQKQIEIRAHKTVCAVGPWANRFWTLENDKAPKKIRATKGVHLVYDETFAKEALFIPIKDGRMFFVIPWKEKSLIGTTDTDFEGNPDEVKVEEEDIQYLFLAAKRVFPNKEFHKDKIITSFAGLRPLVKKGGSPSKVSRKHVIEESYSGIFYVMGGKFTTYRKIAEDVLKKIMKKKPVDTTKHFPLYGSGSLHEQALSVSQNYEVEEQTAQYLINFYGIRYKEVLDLTKGHSSLKEKICSCSEVIKAQVVYSIST